MTNARAKKRKPPSPADYVLFKARLESPKPTVISNWPAFVHPHHFAEAAEWGPKNASEFRYWMRRVTPFALVVAALTAAEMTLALDLPVAPSEEELVAQAIPDTWAWLAGKKLAGRRRRVALVNAAIRACDAARAAEKSLRHPYEGKMLHQAVNSAVTAALVAFVGRDENLVPEFWRRWYTRLACRLAFAGALTTEFQTTVPEFPKDAKETPSAKRQRKKFEAGEHFTRAADADEPLILASGRRLNRHRLRGPDDVSIPQ